MDVVAVGVVLRVPDDQRLKRLGHAGLLGIVPFS
jgi:hypothetical protein